MSDPVRYLSAEGKTLDDFGGQFSMEPGESVYDARTKYNGQWAMMTNFSWKLHGAGRLGLGHGQRYERQANGELHKVEG